MLMPCTLYRNANHSPTRHFMDTRLEGLGSRLYQKCENSRQRIMNMIAHFYSEMVWMLSQPDF